MNQIHERMKLFLGDSTSLFDSSLIENLQSISSHPLFPEVNYPSCLLFSLKVKPEHCNYIQTLHGGAVGTLVDLITSFVIYLSDRKGRKGFLLQLDCNFFRSAKVGEEIFLIGRAIKIGKTTGNAICEIYSSD